MAPTVRASLKRLHRQYVRVCKRKNVYWEISLEDFQRLTSQPCTYCNKPPLQKSRTYVYNGLDRMDPRFGYTLDNVAPCCKECNGIKSNRLTPEEMKAVGQALTAFRKRGPR